MPIDAATFKAEFPVFARTDDVLVEAKLRNAVNRVSECVWGTKYQDGVFYLAAHLLTVEPNGQNARLVAKDGSSTYFEEYTRLQQLVTAGYRLI